MNVRKQIILSATVLSISALLLIGCNPKSDLGSQTEQTETTSNIETTVIETLPEKETSANTNESVNGLQNNNDVNVSENESDFKVANTFLYVNDKYIYSDENAIYYKNSANDKSQKIIDTEPTGQLMSDGETVYFTVNYGASKENHGAFYEHYTVYSVKTDGSNLNKLFTSEGRVNLITCYNGCLYYADNVYFKPENGYKLNKYDLSSGKNTAFDSNDLNVSPNSNIGNAVCMNSKIYFESIVSSDTYGYYDVIEFDMDTDEAKPLFDNSSIVAEHCVADKDKIYFITHSSDDWYISSVDENGDLKKSPKISQKLTLTQGVIDYNGAYAFMCSNVNESDFDLYRVDLESGKVKIIKDGAAKFKNKGSGLAYDLKNTKDIYLIGSGDSLLKFNGNGYDELKVDGTYDPYASWVADGYVINRDFDWCKIN